jgi:hypothetical protein
MNRRFLRTPVATAFQRPSPSKRRTWQVGNAFGNVARKASSGGPVRGTTVPIRRIQGATAARASRMPVA